MPEHDPTTTINAPQDEDLTQIRRPNIDAREGNPDRYGDSSRNRKRDLAFLMAGGIAVVAAVAGWLVWGGIDTIAANVDVQNTGYTLENDIRAVEVHWTLVVPAGKKTSCAVQALNESFTVVGWKVVEIEASQKQIRTFNEKVRITQPAVTGLVYRCWLA